MAKTPGVVRLAALADIHLGRVGYDPPLQTLLARISEEADVLALCGDLTDRGEPDEARQLARALAVVGVPIVAVLGNHDYESGKVAEVSRILSESGVHVLDGEAVEIQGVGFAGVKGFCGGFGRRALGPWGEEMVKLFVREALNEALKLETALGRLRAARKVVLLHYSPIAGTVEGEPLEIYPFLGSSRLEEPLTRYPVDVVFHGHAHHGSAEGRTMGNVPVYNVSMSLLHRLHDGAMPFRVVELRTDGPGGRPAGSQGDGQAATDGHGERRSEHQDRRAPHAAPTPNTQGEKI
jgi:Icc-related predicted phosphoesterase